MLKRLEILVQIVRRIFTLNYSVAEILVRDSIKYKQLNSVLSAKIITISLIESAEIQYQLEGCRRH